MKAGISTFAGNVTRKFPFDIIMKSCVITTASNVANRILQVSAISVTGAVVVASQTNMDLLGGVSPSTGVSSHTEVAVPANQAITVSGGVSGDTVVMTFVSLP